MQAFLVTVDSSGYSADWIDTYVVVAPSAGDAENIAAGRLRADFPFREVTNVQPAVPLGRGTARAIGRIAYPEE